MMWCAACLVWDYKLHEHIFIFCYQQFCFCSQQIQHTVVPRCYGHLVAWFFLWWPSCSYTCNAFLIWTNRSSLQKLGSIDKTFTSVTKSFLNWPLITVLVVTAYNFSGVLQDFLHACPTIEREKKLSDIVVCLTGCGYTGSVRFHYTVYNEWYNCFIYKLNFIRKYVQQNLCKTEVK